MEKKHFMTIDGKQQQQLCEALLNAFPTRQDLEMMVAYGLSENLSAIAGDGKLEHTVFELIKWSRARGRLEELVVGAVKQNGRNAQLISVVLQLGLRLDSNVTHLLHIPPLLEPLVTKTSIFHFNAHLPTPDEFYGRRSERITLISRIRNRGSVAIAGPRRVGKTWLIEYLKLIAPTHTSLGPMYCVGILSATHPHIQTATGFVKRALEVLKVPIRNAQPKTLTLVHLATAVQDIAAQHIIPVLCIDECEGLIGKPSIDENFIEGLRAMAQDDGLVLIFVGKMTLRETVEHIVSKTSPLFNIVQQLTLRPFNEQEATQFVIAKGQVAGFDEQERAFFLECAARQQPNGPQIWPPLLLQLTGQLLQQDKNGLGDGLYPYNIEDTLYRDDFRQRLDASYKAVVNE